MLSKLPEFQTYQKIANVNRAYPLMLHEHKFPRSCRQQGSNISSPHYQVFLSHEGSRLLVPTRKFQAAGPSGRRIEATGCTYGAAPFVAAKDAASKSSLTNSERHPLHAVPK